MSSSIESKIQSLQVRLQAEIETRDQVQHEQQPPPFDGLRPGSGRRPNNLGDITQRRQLDLPLGSMRQLNNRMDQETDKKLREIMKRSGLININGQHYQTDIKDLDDLGELGNGTSGHVVKMRHRPSGTIIAVKQMRRTGNDEENKRIIMDLDVVLKSHDCPYIVQCLGCFITDADVWICMELMSTCFDKLQKRSSLPVPEDILGKVTVATVKALSYLKEKHGVIHRDVKPSNILIDERGNIKLCDFGISGRLVDSKANTRSAGCAAYMAPERIDPKKREYDIRADVWSLGITLVELATGSFPYKGCKTDFEVLTKVLESEPPSLPKEEGFSYEFQDFVCKCLTKDHCQRPKYPELLEQPYLKRYESKNVDVPIWFSQVIDKTGIKTHRRISPPKQLQQQLDLLQQQQHQQQHNSSIKKPNNYQLYNNNSINNSNKLITSNGGNYNQQQSSIPLGIITSSTNTDVTTKNNFIEQQQQQQNNINNLNNTISCDKNFLLINNKNINQQQLQLQQQQQKFLIKNQQQLQQKQLINENLELEKIINNNKKKIFLDNNKLILDNNVIPITSTTTTTTTNHNIITSKIPITITTGVTTGITSTTPSTTTTGIIIPSAVPSTILLNDENKKLKYSPFIQRKNINNDYNNIYNNNSNSNNNKFYNQQTHSNQQNNDIILTTNSPKKESMLNSISHNLIRNLKTSPFSQKKNVLNTKIPINNEHNKLVSGNVNSKISDGFWNITQPQDSGGGGGFGVLSGTTQTTTSGCENFLTSNNGISGACNFSGYRSDSCSPSPLPTRKLLQTNIVGNDDNQFINLQGNTSPIVLQRFYHQQSQLRDKQHRHEQQQQPPPLHENIIKNNNGIINNSNIPVYHSKTKLLTQPISQQMYTEEHSNIPIYNNSPGTSGLYSSTNNLTVKQLDELNKKLLLLNDGKHYNSVVQDSSTMNHGKDDQGWFNSIAGVVKRRFASYVKLNLTGTTTNPTSTLTSTNCTNQKTKNYNIDHHLDYLNTNENLNNKIYSNSGIGGSNKKLAADNGKINPYFMQEHLHQQHQQQQLMHQHRQQQQMNSEDFYKTSKQQPQVRLLNTYDRRHRSPDPPPRYNRGQSPLLLRRNLLEYGQTSGTTTNGQNYPGSPVLPRSYVSSSPPLPPPRRGSESVPGSPQHLRTRINYTPEPQRRYYRSIIDHNAVYPVTTTSLPPQQQQQHHKFSHIPQPRDHQ